MNLNPDDWALATAAQTDESFRSRVRRCGDIDRLRAAVSHEATRINGTRPGRVGAINQRIQEVTD